MGLIDNAKEIADLVKKIGDIELYRKIVQLEGEIIDLSRKTLKLEQENDQLRSNAKKRENLKFEAPFFVDSETNQKCCPQCWQRDQRVVYLIGDHIRERPQYLNCPTCHRRYTWDAGRWEVYDTSGGRGGYSAGIV